MSGVISGGSVRRAALVAVARSCVRGSRLMCGVGVTLRPARGNKNLSR